MSDISRIQRLARRMGKIYDIDAGESVSNAVARLEEKEVGCLLVRESGQLVGIFTERDVIRCLVRISQPPQDVCVGEVMTREIISCDMQTSVAKAQLIMAANGIRHLPVMKDGQPVGMISSRDILAGKLQEANEALVRTAEDAEKARGAKDEILANLSHELRTPLNGIMGMTELALETPLDPTQKEYLSVVRQSADELDNIIRALLDFAGIETGQELLTEQSFCLPQLLRTTLAALGQRAENKELDFILDLGDVPEWVVGDSGRLSQVLNNVIGNAIKFTPSGRVEVSVDTLSQSTDFVRIGFTVRDSGKGIPPNKLQEIFDAFQQVDGSNTREFGGTGLGLAIAARIVHLMGGEITASSRVGQGSRFHFTVRLALAKEQGIANQQRQFRVDALAS